MGKLRRQSFILVYVLLSPAAGWLGSLPERYGVYRSNQINSIFQGAPANSTDQSFNEFGNSHSGNIMHYNIQPPGSESDSKDAVNIVFDPFLEVSPDGANRNTPSEKDNDLSAQRQSVIQLKKYLNARRFMTSLLAGHIQPYQAGYGQWFRGRFTTDGVRPAVSPMDGAHNEQPTKSQELAVSASGSKNTAGGDAVPAPDSKNSLVEDASPVLKLKNTGRLDAVAAPDLKNLEVEDSFMFPNLTIDDASPDLKSAADCFGDAVPLVRRSLTSRHPAAFNKPSGFRATDGYSSTPSSPFHTTLNKPKIRFAILHTSPSPWNRRMELFARARRVSSYPIRRLMQQMDSTKLKTGKYRQEESDGFSGTRGKRSFNMLWPYHLSFPRTSSDADQ